MTTTEDVITYLKGYDNPTIEFWFDIAMDGLDDFILPETNLYSLVMLSKAYQQGLDLVFVDKEKFRNVSVMKFAPTILINGPFEGARYVEFDLSPILLDGYEFTFSDHVEGYGYGFVMDTMNFANAVINHLLKGTGRTTLGEWYDERVSTVEGLAAFINKFATSPLPESYKEPLWNYLLYPLIGIGFGIYYFIKYSRIAIQYLYRILNS